MRRWLGPFVSALIIGTTLSACSVDEGQPRDTAALSVSTPRDIHLDRWDGNKKWKRGTTAGTSIAGGQLKFAAPVGSRKYDGRRYDTARWTSPWTAPGFSYTELIASWSAKTPADSWVEIQVRGSAAATGADPTGWDVLARWARNDRHIQRTTISGQSDDGTSVNVDTWRTGGLAAYQLRVVLLRKRGTSATPSLDFTTAMTSRLPNSAGTTSKPGVARGIVLPVPRYSQMIHSGHYPKWGGGGEAWCSPTSTSMVLAYYDALPKPKKYDWVPGKHVDPWVDYAARMTYDHGYDGTGNWPFNTAYAAARAGKGFVTRLRSLRQAEQFVAAGVPLVVSIAFARGQLDGAPISSSNGHLLVIAGFRKNGKVVVNDPAASTNKDVRRTYRRDQFEKIWLEASGGLAYVIHDDAHPLPKAARGNW